MIDLKKTRPLAGSVIPLILLMLASPISSSPSLAQLPQLEDNLGETLIPPPPRGDLISTSESYILGPGDLLRIEIFEAPEYSGESQILVNGILDLPIGGRLQVEGMTLPEVTEAVRAEYARIFRYPLVSVRLTGPRPLQVAVSGEVSRPGAYLMEIPLKAQGGLQRGVQYPTVRELLELAGGVTLTADLNRVEIRRTSRVGKEELIELDLQEYLRTGSRGQDMTLRDGDTLFVPTTTELNPTAIRQLAATNFAIAPDSPRSVAIVGAVNRPGNYVLIGGPSRSELRPGGLPTVTWAIEQAGGIVSQANIREVEIRRITNTGAEQILTANLWEFLEMGDFRHNPILQDGDTIIVPRAAEINPAEAAQLATASFSAPIVVYVVGEVNKSSSLRSLEVPTNTTLNQAILEAGGFTDRSDRDEVEFIRLNPDGTVTQRTIELDFARAIDEQVNPILRQNDIIVVSRSGLARVSDTLEMVLGPAPEANSLIRMLETLGIISN